MGLNLDFFPRQTLVCANSMGRAEYYSDPVCVRRFESLTFEFRLFGLIGTSPVVDVFVETAADLTVQDSFPSPWRVILAFPGIGAAPEMLRAGLTMETVSRYVRARVMLHPEDAAMTFSFIATARGN